MGNNLEGGMQKHTKSGPHSGNLDYMFHGLLLTILQGILEYVFDGVLIILYIMKLLQYSPRLLFSEPLLIIM